MVPLYFLKVSPGHPAVGSLSHRCMLAGRRTEPRPEEQEPANRGGAALEGEKVEGLGQAFPPTTNPRAKNVVFSHYRISVHLCNAASFCSEACIEADLQAGSGE